MKLSIEYTPDSCNVYNKNVPNGDDHSRCMSRDLSVKLLLQIMFHLI